MLAFRSLDPFRALREPDRRRPDEERPFPLRTKNCQRNKQQSQINCPARAKSPLTGESPIQVTSQKWIDPGFLLAFPRARDGSARPIGTPAPLSHVLNALPPYEPA